MKGYPKVITMKLRIRSGQVGSEKPVNEYSITKTGLSPYFIGSGNACERVFDYQNRLVPSL